MTEPVSARGLFRAMGKGSKPTARRMLDGTYEKVDAGLERVADEFYPTPPEPTLAFMHAEGRRLRDFPMIWEAAVGDGAMKRDIESCGFQVWGSDLIDRGAGGIIKSFFDFDEPTSSAIVTNPPFALVNWKHGKARWITHALRILQAEYMALLLPWPWPGAAGLEKIWHDHPPARVYLMRWKIDFTGQGAPPMLNGWFVWDKQWQGETVLRMLDRKDATQGELL